MSILTNVKHERFAQEVAKGLSQREAYRLAGYTSQSDAAADANASRLITDDKVSARVAEILGKAAVRTELTVASLTTRLLAIAAKAEISDDAPMLQAARASIMDAAKLNGMIMDKVEVKTVMDPEERKARIAALLTKANGNSNG